jgi:hypothetical protein
MFLQLNVPNVFLAEPVKILRENNNQILKSIPYMNFKDLNTKGPDEQQSTTLQNELPNDSNVHINGYHL